MVTAFISIGSNIDPELNIEKAVMLLSQKTSITGVSTFYKTKAFDRDGQPMFLNGVICIETDIKPIELKQNVLRVIEKSLGRIRSEDKSAARTIDLDIIIYNQMKIHDHELNIPDPSIEERPFLAIPLYELSPDLILPEISRSIREIANFMKNHHMKPMMDFTDRLKKHLSIPLVPTP